jgi:hypothetical protein
MVLRSLLAWGLSIAVCLALLLGPALWNGFPLLQFDTGGYLARWYESTLELSRAVPYGLLLTAGAGLSFWPVVVVQAALTVWVIALTLRTHGLGGRPWVLLFVVAVLSVITTLPWLSSILLTDIFAGLAVLALHLVTFKARELRSYERIGLIVLIAYAAATHSATLAVLLMLVVAAAAVRLFAPARVSLAGIGRGATALALGAAMVFAANYVVAKRIAWTPGGFSLSFGRMLQDGIVDRYLADHCPDPRLRLCAYRAELPRDADQFFWGGGVFDDLGRFAGLGAEMETIALGSLIDYPWLQIKAAVRDTAEQLVDVRTGEGVVNSIWHTYAIIERYTPWAAPAMRAARQQRGHLDFTAINALHYPVAIASMLLLLGILALAVARPYLADLGLLATTVTLALLANAFVCGALANPHDRYGARLVWLATLVVVMLLLRLRRPLT